MVHPHPHPLPHPLLSRILLSQHMFTPSDPNFIVLIYPLGLDLPILRTISISIKTHMISHHHPHPTYHINRSHPTRQILSTSSRIERRHLQPSILRLDPCISIDHPPIFRLYCPPPQLLQGTYPLPLSPIITPLLHPVPSSRMESTSLKSTINLRERQAERTLTSTMTLTVFQRRCLGI